MFNPFHAHEGPEKRTPQARFFIDPEYFKVEMNRWFANRWVTVGPCLSKTKKAQQNPASFHAPIMPGRLIARANC